MHLLVLFAYPKDRLSSVKQISVNQVLGGRKKLFRVCAYPGFHHTVLLLFPGKTNPNLK